MAKKKSNTEVTEVVGIPQQSLGSIGNFAGAEVSLNCKVRTYFGLGDPPSFKVWLTPGNYTCVLPEDLTNEESESVATALRQGVLLMGKHKVDVATKDPNTKQKYIDIQSRSAMCNPAQKQPFVDLVRARREGGWTALEVLGHCLDFERKIRNNEVWITFLKAGIDAYQGPVSDVQDFSDEQEQVIVDLEKGEARPFEDGPFKKDDLRVPVGPQGVLPSKQAQEKALDEHFG